MSATVAAQITEEQKQHFRDEGYMILERAIPDEHLQMLREECQFFIDLENRRMEAAGKESDGINHKGTRYFISQRFKESKRLHEFLFSELMAEICKATIGENSYLFWEQYVVKSAEKGMKFGWHQDSGYVGFEHTPYLTCWCALDDMSEQNGTAYVMPFSRQGTREIVPHTREEGSNDLICYRGEDPGDPILVPAGSIACFTSRSFHRSGFNRTNKMRRVYLPQYSPEPIINPKSGQAGGFTIPFLKNGVNVYKHEA